MKRKAQLYLIVVSIASLAIFFILEAGSHLTGPGVAPTIRGPGSNVKRFRPSPAIEPANRPDGRRADRHGRDSDAAASGAGGPDER